MRLTAKLFMAHPYNGRIVVGVELPREIDGVKMPPLFRVLGVGATYEDAVSDLWAHPSSVAMVEHLGVEMPQGNDVYSGSSYWVQREENFKNWPLSGKEELCQK